ncbi:2793_t:CDS:2, partial [Entrophospora sp. SA101]
MTSSNPILIPQDAIKVENAYEEVFFLYTVGNPLEWEHNQVISQKKDYIGINQTTITIFQNQSELSKIGSTGSVLWDSSVLLLKFLIKHHDWLNFSIEKTKIIELGSGCGLIGIGVMPFVKIFMMTDQISMIKHIWKNVNGTSSEINEDSSSNEFPRRVKSFVYRNVLNVDISQDTPDLSSYAISAITTRPPHVNYPSDISGSENINKFNNDENHIFIPDIRYATTGDFVGSAPVGAGRWSTLKRKKNNCYKNSSTIINNNDTEYDNVDGLSPSSSFTIASANEIKNSLENNLQQQQQQQTALLRSKDITQSKNITDE